MKEILSSTITHPRHIENNYEAQGIALFILNSNGHILLIQQREADVQYGRQAEQWNVVTETREEPELVKGTVWRAIKEELGYTSQNFKVVNGTYLETNQNYIEKIGYEYKFRCIVLLFIGNPNIDPNLLFSSQDNEILSYAWVNLNNLDEYDLEEGAKLVIESYKQKALLNI